MCSRTYWLAPLCFSLWSLILLSGCAKPDGKIEAVSPVTEQSTMHKDVTKAVAVTNSLLDETDKTEVFAPTVENERLGGWLGGPPAINKRASGINTYYRIKKADTPQHLTVTLRFEGVVADDASVYFRPIDGATFKLSKQRTKWRLKPNVASEITFTIVVPEGVSYLVLDTFQDQKGAARAFLLETPIRTKV